MGRLRSRLTRSQPPAIRALPGWPAGAHDPDSLSHDLTVHLYASLQAVSRDDRPRARWVMTADWLNECRKLDSRRPMAGMRLAEPECILGLPVEVREGSGPPHLELAEATAP